jgi:hypothetical protein
VRLSRLQQSASTPVDRCRVIPRAASAPPDRPSGPPKSVTNLLLQRAQRVPRRQFCLLSTSCSNSHASPLTHRAGICNPASTTPLHALPVAALRCSNRPGPPLKEKKKKKKSHPVKVLPRKPSTSSRLVSTSDYLDLGSTRFDLSRVSPSS